MNPQDLEGVELDAAVAQIEGVTLVDRGPNEVFSSAGRFRDEYTPSTSWALGGPIIEREGINTFSYIYEGQRYWAAHMEGQAPTGTHGCKSLLIAAMRAFVAARGKP